ncbi:MAG: hypothetical protein EBU81_14560, partial [Proteobacteria bacterium]|nr:hypothetical protein [Pseudomonadota bacterium]
MAGTNGEVKVSVNAGQFTDLVGNASTEAGSLSLSVDTIAPTVAITSDASGLKAGATATLSFTFSEPPATVPNVTPVLGTASGSASDAGALSALSRVGGSNVYTATYTPPVGQAGGKVGFLIGNWGDAAGNVGLTGAAPLIEIDTVAPTVTAVASDSVIKGPYSMGFARPDTTLDLTFSEVPAGLPTLTANLTGVTVSALPVLGGNGAPTNKVSYSLSVPVGL